MPAAIKFCGLTRAADAARGVELGAAFLGVIFAGGPRQLDAARAREVLAPTHGRPISRVGVFGLQAPDEIVDIARAVDLDVVQLHAERTVAEIASIRTALACDVWVVARIAGGEVPPRFAELFSGVDGVVLDSRTPGVLGGSGTRFDWNAVRGRIPRIHANPRLILAGGLTPENVAEGVRTLHPDVVDVSSGVESRVGEKDHTRMAPFARAAHSIPNDS